MAALSVVTNLVPIPIWRIVYGRNVPNLGYLDAGRVMRPGEWRTHQIVHTIMCVSVWAAVLTGHAEAVFALYVIPATIGRLLMGVFLSWLPHRPFAVGDPYQATALRPGRLVAVLSVGQNMHLIHHLWPRVPFYRLHRLFREIGPVLRDRGASVR
jgi:fatty acid desaturase